MVVRSQDGVVIEVRRGLTGTLETMDTQDSTGTLVTGQSMAASAPRAVRSPGRRLNRSKYDRFLAETSRTETLRKGAGTLIADQSIGSYSTKAGAV
jgi:hypothetical protein